MDDRFDKSIVEPRLYLGPEAQRSDQEQNVTPTQGQLAIVLATLLIGIMLLGIQLWILTVALDLYLGGSSQDIWALPLISFLIFAGGLFSLRMLGKTRYPKR
ncbi:MAG TPA: DUF6755 family protein [Chloroflexia bacterium]|nr:DUF6755 family protein [Chloroflexia bacterium]